MGNFDYRKLSKLTFPSGINETEYLQFEKDGTWTASSRDRVCVSTNTNLGYAVATLNAKLHPVSSDDRNHMITSLQNWIQHNDTFLEKYGTYPQWQSEAKSVRRGVSRMQKEIVRLNGMDFLQ